ncbi:hypothetical protein BKA83DRAFT_4235758 [Pisolithus microcarpus]|nr:hypothetical protein BKA83DRAFT_4235758 [Pisolithus microcarpus]
MPMTVVVFICPASLGRGAIWSYVITDSWGELTVVCMGVNLWSVFISFLVLLAPLFMKCRFVLSLCRVCPQFHSFPFSKR